MVNLITGLKYHTSIEKLETEEQLFSLLEEIKEDYQGLRDNFLITSLSGKPVKSFYDFMLKVFCENPKIILKGSGNVGGLEVKNASLEYDLSKITDLCQYWDIFRDGSCHSCDAQYQAGRDTVDNGYACGKGISPMVWNGCKKYDARIKNSEGKTARPLMEILKEAAKEEAVAS